RPSCGCSRPRPATPPVPCWTWLAAVERHPMATSMDLIKPLVTLVAIVNPLGIVPFFIHYTQGYSHAQRQRTARVSAFSAFLVISLSALLGQQLLNFFGISIASFQVGGGLLLLISSLSMLNAQ